MKVQQYLNEVKATSISTGKTFTLSGDIGEFKKGEKVTITDVSDYGGDIKLELENEAGVTDTFYLDRNDDFEELN